MNVVFDIGNVLIGWDPSAAYAEDFGGQDGARAFLDRIGFAALNLRADGGARFADLAQELADPADQALLADYPNRFAKTIAARIEGTWDLLRALEAKGTPLYAITNWSAETWPKGLALHPDLGTAFRLTVVSGQEAICKPEPAIFQILCERAGLLPQDCLFIDDSLANVAGARAAGFQSIHFTSPDNLGAELRQRGLL